jgi:hypothetical protein
MVAPAKRPSQTRKASVAIRTIPILQPRPIGSTRPSSRAPPSIMAANTIAPKIASNALDR